MKIEALGTAETKDAFAGVTELANQESASTGAERLAAATLGVVEIEFYEPSDARLN